jgi:hypothetical protein
MVRLQSNCDTYILCRVCRGFAATSKRRPCLAAESGKVVDVVVVR